MRVACGCKWQRMVMNDRLSGSDVDPSGILVWGSFVAGRNPSENPDCPRFICNDFKFLFINFFSPLGFYGKTFNSFWMLPAI